MRVAREVTAVVITEAQAQDLLARGADRNVRVTPSRDIYGNWFLAANVVAEMKAGMTFEYLDNHVATKVAPTKVTLPDDDDDGQGDDGQGEDAVRVRKLDGTTETKTITPTRER